MPKKSVKLVENTENTENTENNETESAPTNNEIIDVEWEKVQPIFEFKQRLVEMEEYFGAMCLQFEKSKSNLMSQIMYGQNDLYTMAQSLQKEVNVDDSFTYELKLPSKFGEKGFFVRKDN